eukprot:2245577-Pyramimonas_sp.AAC.1
MKGTAAETDRTWTSRRRVAERTDRGGRRGRGSTHFDGCEVISSYSVGKWFYFRRGLDELGLVWRPNRFHGNADSVVPDSPPCVSI